MCNCRFKANTSEEKVCIIAGTPAEKIALWQILQLPDDQREKLLSQLKNTLFNGNTFSVTCNITIMAGSYVNS